MGGPTILRRECTVVQVRGEEYERVRIYVGGSPPEEVLAAIGRPLTVIEGHGLWEGMWEESTVIELIVPPLSEIKLDALGTWASRQGEEAMLVTTEYVGGMMIPLQPERDRGAAPSDAVPGIGEGW